MKKILLTFLSIFVSLTLVQSQIATYDFDANISDATVAYTPSSCNDMDEDFFGTVSEATIDNANIDYVGDSGNFFGAIDIDADAGCPGSPAMMTLAGFDVSAEATDVVLCIDIAEDDDGAVNQDWDLGDDVVISACVDGGGDMELFAIGNDGVGNTEPSIDGDCSGQGDAVAPITETFTTYCVTVPGSGAGAALDIKVTVMGLTSGDEDIAMDNFELYSAGTEPVAAMGACSVCSMGPAASAATGSVGISTVSAPVNGGAVDVNTLDDALITAQEGMATSGGSACEAGTYIQTYGAVTADGVGGGTISGLVDLDGNAVCTVPFQLYEIGQVCADNAVIGDVLTSGGSTGTTLQDAAPTPTGLDGTNIFTENTGSGQTSGRNQVCFDFTGCNVMSVSFWLGDVETSDLYPGYVFVYDEAGNLIDNQTLPTTTSVADQMTSGNTLCEGSSAADNGGDCGNDETVFIDISADMNIGQVCVQVGDFPDEASDPGASEHLSFGGVSTGGTCTPVPVELTTFTGDLVEEGVFLAWATATELDNSHFELERSFDGKNFEAITKIAGAGTTVEPQAYSFLDENPKTGVNYYRLKQVDFNGSFEYSTVITLNTDKNNMGTKVFPSPTSDVLHVAMEYTTSKIQIMDVTGRVVKEFTFDNTENAQLDVANLVPGTYFVAIHAERGVDMTRFVKK